MSISSYFLSALLIQGAPVAKSVDVQIVAAYRVVRTESSGRFDDKVQRVDREIERIEALPRIPDAEVPRYIAYRATKTECGGLSLLPKNFPALASRFGPSVRARWKPQARLLWEEAFYSNRTPVSVVETLRREGQDVGALEAYLIAYHGDPLPPRDYARVGLLLDYAEAHPRDIVAATRAALWMHLRTVDALDGKGQVRSDLIRRSLALHPRTLRNVNVLLDDHLPSLITFRVLKDTARKAGVGTTSSNRSG